MGKITGFQICISVGLIICCRHMPSQVHAVVKQPQHIKVLILGLSEHHKVAPTSALASYVQGADARPDIVSRFGTPQLWPVV